MIKACFISPLGYGLYRPETGLPFGGAEVQFFLLAQEIAKDPRRQVVVLTTVDGAAGTEPCGRITVVKRQGKKRLGSASASSLVARLSGYAGALRDMYRQLRAIDADIYLHAGAGVEVGAYAVICRLLRKRLIYVVASSADLISPNGGLKGPLSWLYPLGLRLAHAVVCRTGEQQAQLRRRYGRDSRLVRTGHPIPAPKSMEDAHQKAILWVGRLHPLKQPDLFLDLAEQFPCERFAMVVMKDAAHPDVLDRVRRRAGALSNVALHEDMPWTRMDGFFAQAKLFINTSTYEGFPNTFVQAALHGAPILSWRVNPDGILTRPGQDIGRCAESSFERLKADVEQFCADEHLRRETGARARGYAEAQHDVAKAALALDQVMHDLVCSGGPSARKRLGPDDRTGQGHLCFVGPAASVTTRRWAGWFAQRGYRVTLVTVEPTDEPLPEGMTQIDLGVKGGPGKLGRIVSALRLAWVIRKLKPDVVHVHYARGLAWGLLLARANQLVITPWGSDILEEQGAFKEWYSLGLTCALLRKADLITVHSDYMESHVRPLLRHDQAVARIGWGVDLSRFRPDLHDDPLSRGLRSRWRIGRDRHILFSPRLAQPFYNLALIIQALPQVCAKVPEALLVLSEQSADPAYVADLHRLVEALGLVDQVLFAGSIPYADMPYWLNLAEAVVMVPRSDGMPNSLWEAMACGAVPVLADLPQYREVIGQGKNGFLVKPEPEELAAALLSLLNDPKGRERMAHVNRTLVTDLADQNREMARMEGWYVDLMGADAAAPLSAGHSAVG